MCRVPRRDSRSPRGSVSSSRASARCQRYAKLPGSWRGQVDEQRIEGRPPAAIVILDPAEAVLECIEIGFGESGGVGEEAAPPGDGQRVFHGELRERDCVVVERPRVIRNHDILRHAFRVEDHHLVPVVEQGARRACRSVPR